MQQDMPHLSTGHKDVAKLFLVLTDRSSHQMVPCINEVCSVLLFNIRHILWGVLCLYWKGKWRVDRERWGKVGKWSSPDSNPRPHCQAFALCDTAPYKCSLFLIEFVWNAEPKTCQNRQCLHRKLPCSTGLWTLNLVAYEITTAQRLKRLTVVDENRCRRSGDTWNHTWSNPRLLCSLF